MLGRSVYLNAPDRLLQCWDWFCALMLYDWGDPVLLSELIRKKTIPPEFTGAIAAIVAGTRKPNRRAAAKHKIRPAERIRLAERIDFMFELLDQFEAVVGGLARRDRMEPIDVLQSIRSDREYLKADLAREYGVSPETIENVLREFRRRVTNWPLV